ncbi:hypothetical protein CALCODRAFT_330519 [Calocera cornea HHB12733]|uniref:Uncharacterized protein n=1 Tax=Calocera cornea HHB12733 TaxID=1353952 RepID=A0A165F3N6_9BASI|nr:hypothetical protein CALCODRAFT_330519 [Calocera cornea HHB12733]
MQTTLLEPVAAAPPPPRRPAGPCGRCASSVANMETRKEHPDTLPQFSPPLKNIPLGQATLPYEPFAPPPAQLNSRYLTALQALAPIAKQVIKKAVETPRLEDGQLDIESSAAESWDEFGRILLREWTGRDASRRVVNNDIDAFALDTKDGFYPLHKLDRAQYVLPIPSAALSEERYTTARQVNVALLLALLYPSETTQLNSYMQWITFLSQLKETYLLLCADRDKKDLLWVSLERISEICVAVRAASSCTRLPD